MISSPEETTGSPVPVILDTDIGDDIDDTWALAMLLGLPKKIDLKLIVTSTGNTPEKTRLTAHILERAGRTDIPIATGVKTSAAAHNQLAWVGDWDIGGYSGEVIDDGVAALTDAVNTSREPVTILAIGPQTNLAEALRRDPAIAGNARVVAMAGSIHLGYRDSPEPANEYNIRADVEAAREVLAADWENTWTPLDTCGSLLLSGESYAAVSDSSSLLSRIVIENYDAWANRADHPPDASSVLFDTVAAYLSFDERFLKVETVRIEIDDDGFTRRAPSGAPLRAALSWRNRSAFEALLVEALQA